MSEPRYKIEKNAGSLFARVIDTHTGKVLKSYNVNKGKGDGWERADKHCAGANAKYFEMMKNGERNGN